MPLILQFPPSLEPPVAPYGMEQLPLERVVIPMTFPLISTRVRWEDDYNIVRDGFRHTGLDMRAPKMTPIVAPFSGTIAYKLFSFWIYGDNGWRCLGTHLNDDTPGTDDNSNQWDYMFAPNISEGDHVEEGQLIGYVGNSRGATGPHLHFEIYAPDGIRDPYPSLKVAKRIYVPKSVIQDPDLSIPAGQERFDGCVRKYESGELTILLVSHTATGSTQTASFPRYVKFKVPDAGSLDPGLKRAGSSQVWTFMAYRNGNDLNLVQAIRPHIRIKIGPRFRRS